MSQRSQSGRFPARLLLAITASCVVAFAVLAGLVASQWPWLSTGDQAADSAAHRDVITHSWLLAAAKTATAIGSPTVVDVVAAIVVLVLLVLRLWRYAAMVALARGGELICESVTKLIVARPRPALVHPLASASGYSFPSGHAGGSAAVYGVLALLALTWATRWARLVLVPAVALVICAVAASRVWLGVHYPSDVAAGVALGLAWASGTALLARLPGTAVSPFSGSSSSDPQRFGATSDHLS